MKIFGRYDEDKAKEDEFLLYQMEKKKYFHLKKLNQV